MRGPGLELELELGRDDERTVTRLFFWLIESFSVYDLRRFASVGMSHNMVPSINKLGSSVTSVFDNQKTQLWMDSYLGPS